MRLIAFAASLALAPACLADKPPDVGQVQSNVTVLGTFTASNTASATQNYTDFQFGPFHSGTTLMIGTCGLGYVPTNDTFIRLRDHTNNVDLVVDDDACGGQGSLIVFTAPHDGVVLDLRAGCKNATNCGGTVAYVWRRDAHPQPTDVVGAIATLPTEPERLYARDDDGLMGTVIDPEDDHYQGVARFGNRLYWDFAVGGAVPNGDNLFFGKFATSSANTGTEFGPNDPWPSTYEGDAVLASAHAGDPPFNHPGGMQSIGDYLFVPVEVDGEHDQDGQVEGFNIGFVKPSSIGLVMTRGDNGAAWAAITKLGLSGVPSPRTGPTEDDWAGGYLAMTGGYQGERIIIYQILADTDGWANVEAQWIEVGCWATESGHDGCPKVHIESLIEDDDMDDYQGVNLITQADGQVFMIGFGERFVNEPFPIPDHHDNWVDVWRVVWGANLGFEETFPGVSPATTCEEDICLLKVAKVAMDPGGDITVDTFAMGAGGFWFAGNPDLSEPDRFFIYSTDDDVCENEDCDGGSFEGFYLKLNEY